jgi:hypothetical protein
MNLTPDYPQRPSQFDRHFLRLLSEMNVANGTVGPDGCWLLSVIVRQEDALHYSHPVDFWNGQLILLVGAHSEDTLKRVRKRCVDAGWLTYVSGAKRRPARYWVRWPDGLKLPEWWYKNAPLNGCAEMQGQNCGGKTAPESAQNPPRIRTPSIPIPIPNTKNTPPTPTSGGDVCAPEKQDPESVPGGEAVPDRQEKSRKPRKPKVTADDPLFARFWAAYPHRVDKPAALRAWANLSVDETLLQAILAGVERYKATKPDWQNWKNPGPWLNARKWEDEPGEATPSQPGTPPKSNIQKPLTPFQIAHMNYSPNGVPRDANGELILDKLCNNLECPHCKPKRQGVAA